MLLSRFSLFRRRWLILFLPFVFFTILYPFFYDPTHVQRLRKLITPAATPHHVVPDGQGQFYGWETTSQFDPVSLDNVANKSSKELCASFPTHLLGKIQPVLKTGHGTLETRARLHLQSVSACLDNLLIVSDVEEKFDGHDIIDVIADIPTHLSRKEPELEAWRNGSIASGTAANRTAWKTDKYKFLPAVSRAWQMRPEREWYVFYEDDSYVVWDNVFRMLEQLDPDERHYFGSPTPGRKYGWWFGEKIKTWFAYGGPGFILSREAVRRFVAEDLDPQTGRYLGSKMAEKHWDILVDDCCGDSVLGWALWGQNVSLSGIWPETNPHPPHGVPFADRYWCQPILTMHKPSQEDLVGMWRWQWERRVKDVSTTTCCSVAHLLAMQS